MKTIIGLAFLTLALALAASPTTAEARCPLHCTWHTHAARVAAQGRGRHHWHHYRRYRHRRAPLHKARPGTERAEINVDLPFVEPFPFMGRGPGRWWWVK
jgi:hypothetical protein